MCSCQPSGSTSCAAAFVGGAGKSLGRSVLAAAAARGTARAIATHVSQPRRAVFPTANRTGATHGRRAAWSHGLQPTPAARHGYQRPRRGAGSAAACGPAPTTARPTRDGIVWSARILALLTRLPRSRSFSFNAIVTFQIVTVERASGQLYCVMHSSDEVAHKMRFQISKLRFCVMTLGPPRGAAISRAADEEIKLGLCESAIRFGACR